MARTKREGAGDEGPRRAGVQTGASVLVWVLSSLAALVMASAALLVSLRVDEGSRGFGDVVRLADVLDLGLLERSRGLVSDPVLDVVLPWGLTALAWLVVGRLLVALLQGRRPSRATDGV